MEHYLVRRCRTQAERTNALEIRRKVFVVEQHIDPQIERDDKDEEAEHFLAFADERPVAALRLVRDGHQAKLGRMAVLTDYRRQGVGRDLLKETLAWAKAAGIEEIYLHSQANARAFYIAMGFVEDGEPHMEAGIPHQRMRNRLINDK
jgi:predicted GNAT family N-acyltransferase